ncbi:MAG: AGE family epimerase/isomerase [Candidatus Competibacteraceae bacterium]|nr:AGE family epimerase/isomerase [Candidatus Competibacteraceae bacterium]
MIEQQPDFRDPGFLVRHIESIMAFYHPRCIDSDVGGFFQHFRDDGSIYDPNTRHLVSSTRFVFNYAMAARQLRRDDYRQAACHGLAFLRDAHRNPETGGYAWILDRNKVRDATNHCYGLAFVILAYATALRAGLDEAGPWLEQASELMEQHFWSEADGLYKDEISADWQTVSPYRGQNANMHTCEAMLAAYQASGDEKYLERAHTLARRVAVDLAAKAGGLIWEHYDEHWEVDWDYNRDNPKHLFRPWGFQPGHQTEWAKLLLILARHRPEDWLLPRARELFDAALEQAWDADYGGICYGVAPGSGICDGDKYFWVQAESFAAAGLLADASGDSRYWDWYDRIWAYAWAHMVDHRHGAWYRILDRKNQKYDDKKSPAGKTDYHTMGACYEMLNMAGPR